jgi:hypothetical protein
MRCVYPMIVSLSIGVVACSGSSKNSANEVVVEPSTTVSVTSTQAPPANTDAPTLVTDAQLPETTAPTPDTTLASVTVEAFSGELMFNWPRDCAVPVSEEVTKNGRDAETSWTLTLTGEGKNLLVQLDDFAVETINGDKVPKAQLEQVSAAFEIPPFVVGPDGQVVEVRGAEELVRKIGPLLGLTDESMIPFVVSALDLSIRSQTWAPWAGAWAPLGTIDAGSTEYEVTQETASGSVITPFVVESLDDAPQRQAHLRLTETVEGEAFRQLLGSTMQQLGGSKVPGTNELEGKRVVVYDAFIDPTTLRPFVTSYDQTSTVTQGTKTQSKTESRRTTFDWDASNCTLG